MTCTRTKASIPDNSARRRANLRVTPDKGANRGADIGAFGCLGVRIGAMFGLNVENAGAVGVVAVGGKGARFWRRGHPVRGALCGLLVGLGTTVFMQQRGYWYFTWENAIAFPVAAAVIFGWRGWRGKAFVRTSTVPPEQTAVPDL